MVLGLQAVNQANHVGVIYSLQNIYFVNYIALLVDVDALAVKHLERHHFASVFVLGLEHLGVLALSQHTHQHVLAHLFHILFLLLDNNNYIA